MDYQSYEDYMRQVLGYSSYNPIYENYNYKSRPYTDTYYRNDNTNSLNSEYDDFYPEIYHLINPMVCKVCSANTEPITKELIEKMTEEIYNSIESDIVNVRIETKKEDIAKRPENNINEKTTKKAELNNIDKANIEKNNMYKNSIEKTNIDRPMDRNNIVKETRRNDQFLRDLIKILILKQLFGGGNRPNTKPPRPNYLPYPGGNNMMSRPPYF